MYVKSWKDVHKLLLNSRFYKTRLSDTFSILSINNNIIPATLNLNNPSNDFKVDLVPNTPIDYKVNIALSNSFGFLQLLKSGSY